MFIWEKKLSISKNIIVNFNNRNPNKANRYFKCENSVNYNV